MGPPPPPSASYLWKFTDSDEESDHSTANISSDTEDFGIEDEDDDDDDDDDDCLVTLERTSCISSSSNGSSVTIASSNNDSNISSMKNTTVPNQCSGITDEQTLRIPRHDGNKPTTTKVAANSGNSTIRGTSNPITKYTKREEEQRPSPPLSAAAMIIEATKANFSSSRSSDMPNDSTTDHRLMRGGCGNYETDTHRTNISDEFDIEEFLRSMNDDDDDNDDDDSGGDGNDGVNQNDGDDIGGETVTNTTTTTTTTTSNKKRKKGKKKRKKKTSTSPTTTVGVEATTTETLELGETTMLISNQRQRHHVSFNNVRVRTFGRCFGLCVVPTRGGWPLGMEYHDFTEQNHDNDDKDSDRGGNHNHHVNSSGSSHLYSVDEYEVEKQERLVQRYRQLQAATADSDKSKTDNNSGVTNQHINNNSSSSKSKAKKKSATEPVVAVPPSMKGLIPSNGTTLETRQWDYKNDKRKNPLFGIVHESDRMHLLLDSCGDGGVDDDATAEKIAPDKPKMTTQSGRSSKSTGRSRSGSIGSKGSIPNHASNSSHHNRVTTTTTGWEQFNHVYTSTYVHSIRNALEQIRIDRSTGIGCNCRKLQVPVAPSTSPTTTTSGHKNSSSKKSHHHNSSSSNNKRMKLQKLKDELIKRNLLSPDVEDTNSMTREEMEQLLHDTVEKEPCCLYTDTCFCARNGIGCQADVCQCWHSSHSSTTKSNSSKSTSVSLTVQEIQQRCGNIVGGMYVVDDHKIDTFRNDYLSRLQVCPFIDTLQ